MKQNSPLSSKNTQPLHYRSLSRGGVSSWVFVLIALLVFGLVGFFTYRFVLSPPVPADSAASDQSASLGNLIEETENDGIEESTALIGTLLKSYLDRSKVEYGAITAVDNSNIYTIESYKSRAAIENTLGLLREAIPEAQNAEAIERRLLQGMIDEATDISTLSPEETQEIITLLLSQQASQLEIIKNRTASLAEIYEKATELYNFVLQNYDSYTIEEDENGEYVFFTDQDLSIRFETLATQVDVLNLEFAKEDIDLLNQINQ